MNDKSFEEYIEIYKDLKKYKQIIGNIDTNFFFDFSDCMIEKILNLENKLNSINKFMFM